MKYLLVDNAAIAKQKAHAALEAKYPNRRTLQEQRRIANTHPNVHYPPIIALGWEDDCEHVWTVNEQTGQCEIEIPDNETHLYPNDLDNIRNERSIGVAQGPPST